MFNAALITRRANELGVKIVAGTDWIFPAKNESVPLLDEMKLLATKCGLSNLQVIEAASLNGALVTGLKDRGVVRVGKRADLLVLNADPTKSLKTFDQPEFVIQKGNIVKK
ncbi:Imidazolonepropionase [compost metagenome]